MEDTSGYRITLLATLVAPIAWGSTYAVTEHFLPPGRPLFAAMMRALPIGLLMALMMRRLPSGDWWWRAAVLGLLNIGCFFPLIFIAAYRLPGGLAATITALSPLAVIGLARLLLAERSGRLAIAGAVVGVAGVALLVLRADVVVDPLGVAAALGAVAISGVGFVLTKRWKPPVDLLTLTSWQLAAGGLFLLPLAFLVEGGPPSLDARAVGAFVYLGVFGTGLAYFVWFRGLRRMGAGTTSILGLVNPVVGTGLGVAFAGEPFGAAQLLGVTLALGGVAMGQPAVVNALRHRMRRRPPGYEIVTPCSPRKAT